jgi:hypothetical protein
VSYDLFFRSRSGHGELSQESFQQYFGGRSHYQVGPEQAVYGNEDTGIYFTFDYNAPDKESDPSDDDQSELQPVAFNLNYFRPHVFGLEAEPEVAAFAKAFDLTVSDPQMSGMGDGEYSADGFLRGWNAGNAFSFRAIISQDSSQRYLSLPSDQIEAVWRWNFNRERLQNEIVEALFVPRIFFFEVDDEVKTAIAWADGIPILMPTVDYVIVPRKAFAPKRFLRPKKDLVVFDWMELSPIIQRYAMIEGELNCHELSYSKTPSDIEKLIREKSPDGKKRAGIAAEQVFDRELLERARSSK